MIKQDEYFWYDDPVSNRIIMGKRGGREFKIDRWDFMLKYDKHKIKVGRELTPEEAYKICLVESQYVDFEEVVDIKGLLQ